MNDTPLQGINLIVSILRLGKSPHGMLLTGTQMWSCSQCSDGVMQKRLNRFIFYLAVVIVVGLIAQAVNVCGLELHCGYFRFPEEVLNQDIVSIVIRCFLSNL